MKLRPAYEKEAEVCYRFIEDARAYHKSLGFEQWHPEYPTLRTIRTDIAAGIGYVFCDEEAPLGYCCIVIGDEPAYLEIDGAWQSDAPYGVVHRMAFGAESRGTGLSHGAVELIKEFCERNGVHSIRVDTQEENQPMQHILSREGFVYCGLITFDGGPKLAYELDW